MPAISRTLVHLAAIITILVATSSATRAQELRDRQLTHAFDVSTIQMPVEIVSITLDGKDIVPAEKFKADDNWLKGISFKLKNVSDQPIAFVSVSFKFPLPNGFVVVSVLNYGMDSSRGGIREPGSLPIQPGQIRELVLTKTRYDSFRYVLAQANAPSSFDTAPFYVERVCFENQPDVIWQGGYLKRRNAADSGRFDPIQRYFLPIKEK